MAKILPFPDRKPPESNWRGIYAEMLQAMAESDANRLMLAYQRAYEESHSEEE